MRLRDNSRRLGVCRRREIDFSFVRKFAAVHSTPSSVNQSFAILASPSVQPSTSGRRVDGCVSRLQRRHTRGVADCSSSVCDLARVETHVSCHRDRTGPRSSEGRRRINSLNAAQMLRNVLPDLSGVTVKKMFGSLCFMLNGNMLCGVHEGGGVARVGKDRSRGFGAGRCRTPVFHRTPHGRTGRCQRSFNRTGRHPRLRPAPCQRVRRTTPCQVTRPEKDCRIT